MENKTFEEQIEELKSVKEGYNFNPKLVSVSSINQMIKAHELKYVENIIEVEEENKLAVENINDFLVYPEEVQKAALVAYEHSQRDPEYFARPGVDQGLYKPVLILTNIFNKKNEAKIKTWKVEYHARLIDRLTDFRFFAVKDVETKLVSLIKSLFSK